MVCRYSTMWDEPVLVCTVHPIGGCAGSLVVQEQLSVLRCWYGRTMGGWRGNEEKHWSAILSPTDVIFNEVGSWLSYWVWEVKVEPVIRMRLNLSILWCIEVYIHTVGASKGRQQSRVNVSNYTSMAYLLPISADQVFHPGGTCFPVTPDSGRPYWLRYTPTEE